MWSENFSWRSRSISCCQRSDGLWWPPGGCGLLPGHDKADSLHGGPSQRTLGTWSCFRILIFLFINGINSLQLLRIPRAALLCCLIEQTPGCRPSAARRSGSGSRRPLLTLLSGTELPELFQTVLKMKQLIRGLSVWAGELLYGTPVWASIRVLRASRPRTGTIEDGGPSWGRVLL